MNNRHSCHLGDSKGLEAPSQELETTKLVLIQHSTIGGAQIKKVFSLLLS